MFPTLNDMAEKMHCVLILKPPHIFPPCNLLQLTRWSGGRLNLKKSETIRVGQCGANRSSINTLFEYGFDFTMVFILVYTSTKVAAAL